MDSPARIAFVCEGDAESYDKAFSGIAKGIVDHLRDLGHTVLPVNARVYHPTRAMHAVRSFSVDRNRWRARFRYGKVAFDGRTALARKMIQALDRRIDMIFQIGANFAPPVLPSIPYVVYCDWNMALSIKNRKSHGLSEIEADRINERHRAIYAGAACIFTICERLRQSFLEDYQIPPGKVIVAYPGANIDLTSIPEQSAIRASDHCPTILFVGKEFHRKGGDILLEAFRIIRRDIPKARLVILGTRQLEVSEPGVEVLGLLRKDVPEERDRLIQAYATADVFCLPSRHDPFPSVVREAMFFRLPCVTTDIWAFPEMVVDGVTGFTVPVDDSLLVADRIGRLLRDPLLRRRMGDAARVRAERLFTWGASARTLHERIQSIVGCQRL